LKFLSAQKTLDSPLSCSENEFCSLYEHNSIIFMCQNSCEDKKNHCCIRFREAWSPGSIYCPGDAVPYQGSSYVAIHPNQNDAPPSGNWALIAGKGDAGPGGAAGAPGVAGSSGSADVYVLSAMFDQTTTDLLPILPAGNYVLIGTVSVANEDGDAQDYMLAVNFGSAKLVTYLGRSNGINESVNGDIVMCR
jgi:hypothetical protein